MGELTKEVTIYTDGGAEPNPGPGGYGVVLIYGNHRRELSGGLCWSTNNRMEIFAVIKALEALKVPCKVTLHCDSKYVVETMAKGWAKAWKAQGWRRNRKHPAINADLWESLLALCEKHQVQFEWVKGHAGNPENERCDVLAMEALRAKGLPEDEGYERTALPSSEDDSEPAQASYTPGPKITVEGQPCRKCQTPVIKRVPRRKRKPGRDYFEYFLYCPGCKTMYMVPDAKRTNPANQ